MSKLESELGPGLGCDWLGLGWAWGAGLVPTVPYPATVPLAYLSESAFSLPLAPCSSRHWV